MVKWFKYFARHILPSAMFVLCVILPGFGNAAKSDAIRIDLDVSPAAKKYIDLAAYPSFLVIALQVNGFSPSSSGKIIIENGRKLRFKNASLTFVRRDKDVFHYIATVDWSIGIAQSKFELPVEADLSMIGAGKIAIRVFPPFAKLFPEQLTENIRLKIQSVANPAVQTRMLEYLDGLPGAKGARMDTGMMFEKILLDAYNLPALTPGIAGAREPGDAESIGDQWMLLTTLAIWLFLVPGFFILRTVRKKKKTAAAKSA